jgi:hypothetical protein
MLVHLEGKCWFFSHLYFKETYCHYHDNKFSKLDYVKYLEENDGVEHGEESARDAEAEVAHVADLLLDEAGHGHTCRHFTVM